MPETEQLEVQAEDDHRADGRRLSEQTPGAGLILECTGREASQGPAVLWSPGDQAELLLRAAIAKYHELGTLQQS